MNFGSCRFTSGTDTRTSNKTQTSKKEFHLLAAAGLLAQRTPPMHFHEFCISQNGTTIMSELINMTTIFVA